MSRRGFRLAIVLSLLFLVLPASGPARAGGPGVWTKLGVTESGADTVGMLRTANGTLHLVWKKKRANNVDAYATSTISLAGKLLATGSALKNWNTLEGDPYLVRNGSGLRLIFKGGQNTNPSNFFSRGSVYTETSANGTTWTLVHGTMAQHTVLNGTLAATNEKDGTPLAAFGLNATLWFHEGVDPNSPASSSDGEFDDPDGNAPGNQTVAEDPSNGSAWMAYYQFFNKTGYYVVQIVPKVGTRKLAPGSADTSKPTNQPNQPVAFIGRVGGGVYMAYCSPSSTKGCAHIDLWKVGTTTPKVVPHSNTGDVTRVALAAGLQGRLTVVWFDSGQNMIHAVRTNKAATAFGVDRAIPAPPGTFIFEDIQAEGTFGRLDVIANVLETKSPNPIEFWHTQILAGLTLTAKPSSFSHTTATTVTFTVTDAGDPVSGATVSCIGKSGKTGSNGTVKLTFPKGTATGKHVCTAAHTDFNVGKTTITVT